MRAVSYARVSTEKQGERGESLVNQERAFASFIAQHGWTRVQAYAESASGKDVDGRETFRQMLEGLDRLRVDVMIVDTLDRFTRSLRDGLNLLEQLRGRNVGLVAIDWGRTTPMNLDDDRDWADLVGEFTAAERERRRIRARVLKSYAGRRARGATLTVRPPFGLMRVNDRLAPDPDTAWIVTEIDRRFLEGNSHTTLHEFARAMHARAWKTFTGVRSALRNEAYVVAGLRSPETHREIAARIALMKKRFGQRRKYDHEFAGVFACGQCVDLGYPVSESLMMGKYSIKREQQGSNPFNLMCGHRGMADERHPEAYVNIARVEGPWRAFMAALSAPGWIDAWAKGETDPDANRVRSLHRRLARLDEQFARLKERRDAAIDLYSSLGATYRPQVAKTLAEIEADEKTLVAQREAALGELARSPERLRDPQQLRAILARLGDLYDRMDARDRNAFNRALCAAIGSHPVVRRAGAPGARGSRWKKPIVTWPEVQSATSVRSR